MKMSIPIECPICHSADTVLFHDKIWNVDEGVVLKCECCNVAFLHPMMSEKQEREFYENYNSHVQSRGVTISLNSEEFHQISRPVASDRFKVIHDLFKPGMRVLEIGSSTGAFLELLADCECSCVEPSHDNREYSKQFVTSCFREISEVPSTSRFDIICMFHVFEHVRNPQSLLKSCDEHLADDGLVIVEVPCIQDPLLTIFDLNSFKDFYFQPMHPFIYSEEALEVCFNRIGMKKKQVIYYQRYGLENHLAWLKNEKPNCDEKFREIFSGIDEYKKRLAENKTTDTIIYVASRSG